MSDASLIKITDNPDVNGNDEVVARNMAETLHRAYPGHLWAVTCEGSKGIATVRNLMLSGNWGCIIKLSELFGDPDMKKVLRAGGEILERFRMSRGKYDGDKLRDLPTFANGMPQFDYMAAKTRPARYIVEAVDRTRRLRA